MKVLLELTDGSFSFVLPRGMRFSGSRAHMKILHNSDPIRSKFFPSISSAMIGLGIPFFVQYKVKLTNASAFDFII